jgi:arginyl-tRNA synthetase
MIKDEIKKMVRVAVIKAYPDVELGDFDIEYPPRKEMGDYSTQIALKLAKDVKEKPQIIAQKIIENLPKSDLIKTAEEKSGFLNFWISDEFLSGEIDKILVEKSDYGRSNLGQGKKVQVEFISANPTGPLTLGNARGGFLGDVLANILSFSGFDAWREYYVNDCGKQIEALGKSVLGIEKIYQGSYIDEIKPRIKSNDPMKAGKESAKIIKEEIIESDCEKMGIGFDEWFWESNLIKQGQVEKMLSKLKSKGFSYEKDGATWFRSTKFGDDKDRVLVKKDGTFTYFATDIANHINKFDRGFDYVIDIWGADHHGDVPRMKAAAKVFGYDKKLEFILHQFVRILEKGESVRMSKRTGKYILIRDLIDEVGLDVVRFFFLMFAASTHIDFDLKLAKEKSEKNPVYYIQYVNARIHGILEKIKNQNEKIKIKNQNEKLLKKPCEIELIKELIKFPEVIGEIAKDRQVQKLPNYLLTLSKKFHNFYDNCRVITDNKELTQARLNLILATQSVLKNGLKLLEIQAPDKM